MSELKKFIFFKGYTFIYLETSKKGFSFVFLHVRDQMHNDKYILLSTLVFLKTVVNPAFTIDKSPYYDIYALMSFIRPL